MSLLEVDDLTQRFGRLAALNRVSFTLGAGEIVGLIGPNGAGKTTFVNTIAGAFRNWTGRVRFVEQPLRGRNPHQIARMGIARTYQVVQPFAEMSALENVMVGALHGRGEGLSVAAAREVAAETLDRLGLAEIAHLRAERLNIPQRKRLELARALVMRPRLLMLDEIMAGLSAKEVDELVGVVRNIRDGGVTVLLIEHVMQAIASLSDRIIVLHHGQKVAEGSPKAVFSDEGVIGAYLGARPVAGRRDEEVD